jgi:hypothetical protein
MNDITWDKIKQIKNLLLQKSDWTQLIDVDLSEEDKSKWSVYRKQLRDITKTFRNPSEVEWPISPNNSNTNE